MIQGEKNIIDTEGETDKNISRRRFFRYLAASGATVAFPWLFKARSGEKPPLDGDAYENIHDTKAVPSQRDIAEAMKISQEEFKKEFREWQEKLSIDVLLPRLKSYISEKLFNGDVFYFENLLDMDEMSDVLLMSRMLASEDTIAPVSVLPFIGHVALNRVNQSKENGMPWSMKQVILGYDNDGSFGVQRHGVPFSTSNDIIPKIKESFIKHKIGDISDISHRISAFQDVLKTSREFQSLVIADMLCGGLLGEYNFTQNMFMHPKAQYYLSKVKGETNHVHPDKKELEWASKLGAVRLNIPIPEEVPEDHIWFYTITNPSDPFAYNIGSPGSSLG